VDFPRSAFLTPARSFLSRIAVIGLGFVLLAAILSRFATAQITTPLAKLTDASEAIAAGDYSQRVVTHRTDEIGRLGAAFNSMVSEIQETQERLTLAVQGSNIGIWEWNATSDDVILSAQWKKLLGYGDSELRGTRTLMGELVHPDDRRAVAAGIHACLKGETESWASEHRLRRKDGSYIWALARGVVRRDESGRPIRFAGTSIDITAQKSAQSEAIIQARHAAFVADVAVALTEGSAMRDMLGRCAQAMVTHFDAAIARVWTANLTDQVLELQATAGGATDADPTPARVPIGEFPIGRVAADRRPVIENTLDGDRVTSDATIAREHLNSYAAFPLVLGDRLVGVMSMYCRRPLAEYTLTALGSVARTVALGIERKQLEESRSRFEDLLESATDFVTIGQPAGAALYVNRALREALELGPDEPVPSLLDFRPPSFREFFDNTVLPTADRDGGWKGQSEYVSRSGRVIPVSQVSVVHKTASGQIEYISTISRDITDERRAAREREDLEEQLRRAQRIEAIGQLAGGLAHDFNNLLTIIMSYTDMLSDQFEEGDARREDLDQIRKAGTRAAQLTRQLLAFSRRQILHPVVLDPNELIQGMSAMLGRLLGENIELSLRLDDHVSAITFDPAQLELILVNLAVNARDAMPHGGRFTIETGDVEIDEEFSRTHLAAEPGPYVRLAVTDTGTGMDEATRKRIFEPFFTTKPTGKGTGLGLATVFGIVKQSGGSIWVYSEPGLGASFKIFLPVAANAKTLLASRAQRLVPTGQETVLIVEDEADVRTLVQTVLKRAGYTILSAGHPAEAVRLASDPSQRIDLLVTDVVMPETNGAALFVKLRETRPTLRVLFMSGFADDAIEHHGVLAAGTPFLQKPFTGPDLASAVRDVLDTETVYD
jgi:PAS domain S-box-containing protein